MNGAFAIKYSIHYVSKGAHKDGTNFKSGTHGVARTPRFGHPA